MTSNEVTLEKDINFFLSRIDSWVKSEDSPNNLIGGTENEESPSGASKSRASDRYEKHVKLQSKIGSIDRQVSIKLFLRLVLLTHSHTRPLFLNKLTFHPYAISHTYLYNHRTLLILNLFTIVK